MFSSESQIRKKINDFKHQIISFNRVIFSVSRTSVITCINVAIDAIDAAPQKNTYMPPAGGRCPRRQGTGWGSQLLLLTELTV